MKEYNTLDDFNVENKTVLLRVDFNMPLDKKTLAITDDTRIRLALPTIQDLVTKNAKTVILAHQGKQGSWDFISLEKHAQMLQKLLGTPVTFIDDIYGEKAQTAIKTMKPGAIVFLDNVRKYTAETEKKKPEKPSVFLFGGAKFADGIVTIDRLLTNKTADHVLLTGLTANAFLKAKGVN